MDPMFDVAPITMFIDTETLYNKLIFPPILFTCEFVHFVLYRPIRIRNMVAHDEGVNWTGRNMSW